MNVAVLGGGSWGSTVASLTSSAHPTVLWARDAGVAAEINDAHTNEAYLEGFRLDRRLRATSDLQEAVSRAEVVAIAVPSKGFRAIVEQARPWVPPGIPVVSLTKGIEAGSLLRMTQIIEEVLPARPAAVLTGPNVSHEILSGSAAATVIATPDEGVAAALQRVFGHHLLRVYRNHDVVGCEVGGALKNVIALASGIAQGLGVGDNTRAAVITRGLAELTRIGVAMGAERQTLAGLAGMGDLIATCISPFSRNRSVGEELGKGRALPDILGSMHMVVEGVDTAGVTLTLAERYDLDLPICTEIYKVVMGLQTPIEALRGLASAGHEEDPD